MVFQPSVVDRFSQHHVFGSIEGSAYVETREVTPGIVEGVVIELNELLCCYMAVSEFFYSFHPCTYPSTCCRGVLSMTVDRGCHVPAMFLKSKTRKRKVC